MKKTVLTFVAVAFGSCVAFAQTTPVEGDQTTNTEQTEQSITVDKMSDSPAEAGRRAIKVEELPEAVQRSLKSGEFKEWKVVTVTELQSTPGTQLQTDNMSNTGTEGEADSQPEAEQAAMLYEVELVSEDMQEEIQDSQAQTEEIAEEAAEEGVVAEEKMVEVKVPGVVLRYDHQGKLLSRVDRAAGTTPTGNQE
ncbi:hypothetical protein [Cesiribacter sp. SM1]|uniref:hypothetical protein n=1 Tax=Cesiribacter sp. SM1 TaxID=2861196 RepID=UPI001CD50DBE|nr:hypothetical protein [Cesiribacter sp. SM1]